MYLRKKTEREGREREKQRKKDREKRRKKRGKKREKREGKIEGKREGKEREKRGKKRGKERRKGWRGREGVNGNFWFKKCDIVNNCSKNQYTGTGTGLQFSKPVPVQISGPVTCLL